MNQLLFVTYLVVFCWLVTKIKFFRNAELSSRELIILFLLKVFAGIIYGWVGLYYSNTANMADTWASHSQGIFEYHQLLERPLHFFDNLIFSSRASGYSGFFVTTDSWWNDIKYLFIIKILAVFNIFSLGNYYTNTIFYSFITLFGPVGLYRIMMDVLPQRRKAVLTAVFLIPSFLYWTSGLHKEGLTFLALVAIIYPVYYGLKRRKITIKRLLSVCSGIVLILICRNFLIIVILPAIAVWIISAIAEKRYLLIYALCYTLFILMFFFSKHVHASFDFPQAVVNKQGEFLELTGGSSVPVDKLQPTAASFANNFFQAFTIAAIRPYPTDVRHFLSGIAALEINLLHLLVILALVYSKKTAANPPFILFCLFFYFTTMLTIGYTVNFLGAVVRYRSIVLPFFITPAVAVIDWKRIKNIFS